MESSALKSAVEVVGPKGSAGVCFLYQLRETGRQWLWAGLGILSRAGGLQAGLRERLGAPRGAGEQLSSPRLKTYASRGQKDAWRWQEAGSQSATP